MIWPPQQDAALSAVARWARSGDQVFYLGGHAGTGKTTLARHFAATAGGRWLFASLTGKAAHVLRIKGCEGASTIHSLIYRPSGESKTRELELLGRRTNLLLAVIASQADGPTRAQTEQMRLLNRLRVDLESERKPMFALWADSPLSYPEITGVVIDEVSMVDDRVGQDLRSFGKKILVLGDPAQLPPVGGAGHFTRNDPDVLLTDIHRQSLDSGVLRLATRVRQLGPAALDGWVSVSDCEVKRRPTDPQETGMTALAADQIIVGRNATRRVINARMRELLGRADPLPTDGDRMVCLRNERELGLLNGSQWVAREVHATDGDVMELTLEPEDEGASPVRVVAWTHHVTDRGDELASMDDRRDLSELDYGYALTCHKAQGSQWNDVLIFDESGAFGANAGRHLYTAITRAAKRVTVIV